MKLKKLSFYAGPSFTAERIDDKREAYVVKCKGTEVGSIIEAASGEGFVAVTKNNKGLPEHGTFPNVRQAGIALLKYAGVIR